MLNAVLFFVVVNQSCNTHPLDLVKVLNWNGIKAFTYKSSIWHYVTLVLGWEKESGDRHASFWKWLQIQSELWLRCQL